MAYKIFTTVYSEQDLDSFWERLFRNPILST